MDKTLVKEFKTLVMGTKKEFSERYTPLKEMKKSPVTFNASIEKDSERNRCIVSAELNGKYEPIGYIIADKEAYLKVSKKTKESFVKSTCYRELSNFLHAISSKDSSFDSKYLEFHECLDVDVLEDDFPGESGVFEKSFLEKIQILNPIFINSFNDFFREVDEKYIEYKERCKYAKKTLEEALICSEVEDILNHNKNFEAKITKVIITENSPIFYELIVSIFED